MTPPIDRPPEVLAAMQKTLEAAQQLERDARAVVCWLDMEFPGLIVSLELQRHYSCEDDELAHVEPRVTDRVRRHEVREAAERALEALGWCLRPEGRDVYSAFYRSSHLQSAHARLAEADRGRQAVDRRRDDNALPASPKHED
ncbi:MAG: hypothetical protein GYB53_20335 [Rhodobacteraceae bacterium]|nr:hypothetical protein [Paracoccaceae bacterium]MBR9823797.1 hypothetical protein [Paracoccaceae bacterium]